MGITSALSTALSGLDANQSVLDVVGNNIANVNTVGFKASTMDFKTQFSQNFTFGSAPNGDLGGTNPIQTGMGVVNGAITRNFAEGSDETTGVLSDLAIQGDGFFIVKDSTGQSYTRDGSFVTNSNNELVNSDGLHVQGFGVDSNFNIVPGVLQNITIPLQTLTVAEPTTNMEIDGSLNANGSLPSTVSDVASQELFVSNGTSGGTTGAAPTAATLLSSLTDSSGTSAYFTPGQTITLTGNVGGVQSATKTLTVSGATTVGDLMTFMDGTLGINTGAGANGTVATTPGATLTAGTTSGSAVLSVFGNVGETNDISLSSTSLSVSGAANPNPLTWTKVATADGESVTTNVQAFDSLGTPVTTNVTVSLMSKTPSGGTVWQYYATSPDSAPNGAQTAVGMGTITFDSSGNFVSATPNTITIDRTGSGASPSLTFPLDFSKVSALTDTQGSVINGQADGSAKGTLTTYSIDQDGIIKGSFSNGLTRTLGQVALATFRNNQGLVDEGNNLFQEGPNSGTAVITAPGALSAGTIASGALELSNVDLSSEFVKLISASTGFSASSRVITTSDQLLQELLSAAR